MKQTVASAKPDFILYNAGTDVFEEDLLGEMRISAAGSMRRDEIVFRCAAKQKIPIVMVLSGGYSKKSATLIGRSIENLFSKGLIRRNDGRGKGF